jgi:LysM repeat protein
MNDARTSRRAECALLAAVTLIFLTQALPAPSSAGVYPREGDIIGVGSTHRVRPDESLYEIARQYGVGYSEIVSANPGFDPFLPAMEPVSIRDVWALSVAMLGRNNVQSAVPG